jgi:hypothetical protein
MLQEFEILNLIICTFFIESAFTKCKKAIQEHLSSLGT